jgi:hypothetical protein
VSLIHQLSKRSRRARDVTYLSPAYAFSNAFLSVSYQTSVQRAGTFQTENRYCFPTNDWRLTIGVAMAGQKQDARYIPPRRRGDSSRRRWRNSFVIRWLVPLAFMIVAVALVVFTLINWPGQTEYSDVQRACIAQRYNRFDAMKLSQCVDVCKSCMKGTTATCNTSCWLKGAS